MACPRCVRTCSHSASTVLSYLCCSTLWPLPYCPCQRIANGTPSSTGRAVVVGAGSCQLILVHARCSPLPCTAVLSQVCCELCSAVGHVSCLCMLLHWIACSTLCSRHCTADSHAPIPAVTTWPVSISAVCSCCAHLALHTILRMPRWALATHFSPALLPVRMAQHSNVL